MSATYLLRDARGACECEITQNLQRARRAILQPKLVCVFDTRALADALGRPIGLKIARLRAGARAWSHLSTSAALQIQSDLAIGTRELSRPPRRAVLALCCWRIIPWRSA